MLHIAHRIREHGGDIEEAQAIEQKVSGRILYVTFGGKKHPVESVSDARRKWCQFRDQSNGGVSEIGNGICVRNGENKIVAKISYNGRVWDTKGKEIVN